MKGDDNDKLWELLGKTRPTEVSPFFSRNVLRSIRQDAEAARKPKTLLSVVGRGLHRWSWRLALAGSCAIVCLVTVIPTTFHRRAVVEEQRAISQKIVRNPDYEVIQHLDELVADEENSVWLDDSVH